MSKILLTRVYLLNWYGFVDTIIPIGKNISLISGDNECGKSTVLDAIKYAFVGDTEFNKASSATKMGPGGRTLSSYTRCLIDPDKKIYARDTTTHPHITTYIALEFYNELYENNFVLGVVLETNVSNNVTSSRFAVENSVLEDISFYEEIDGKKYVLNANNFRDRNGISLLYGKEGYDKFMTMNGLRLPYDQRATYQRKLRNFTTYNPNGQIHQFIKDSVLESKTIDLSKLKETKESLDGFAKTLTNIEQEINCLDKVLKYYEEYEKQTILLNEDNVKKAYEALITNKEKHNENFSVLHVKDLEISDLSQKLSEKQEEKDKTSRDLYEMKKQFDEIDGVSAVKKEKEKLAQLESDGNRICQKLNDLKCWYNKLNQSLQLLHVENTLPDVFNPNVTSVSKLAELEKLTLRITSMKKSLSDDYSNVKRDVQEINAQIAKLIDLIATYEKNRFDYSHVKNQRKLIDAINTKFKELNIDSQARFSSEYVIRVKDERWRDSIESFLGKHRYSILVEPQYFDIANTVLDQFKFTNVELVNTKLLNKKELTVVKDSLMYQLEIKNEIAKKYFEYWLGRIHAVELSEVAKYESAISKEGKISRNMSITFLDFKRIQFYCLGEETIKLNKKNAELQKTELQQKHTKLLAELEVLESKLHTLENMNSILYQIPDFEIVVQEYRNKKEIVECKISISNLEKALENNSEYYVLNERINLIEQTIKEIELFLKKNNEQKGRLEGEREKLQEEIANLEFDKKQIVEKIERYYEQNPGIVNVIQKKYELFVEGKLTKWDTMNSATRRHCEQLINNLESDIKVEQNRYNDKMSVEEQLSVGLGFENEYRARKNRIDIDDIQEIKEQIHMYKKEYEKIFKNEFVLKIYTNIEHALKDIKNLNKQLSKVDFSTDYKFDVKKVTGISEFAKILEYGEYLKNVSPIDNQLFLGSVVDYDEAEAEKRENEIQDIVNKIISGDNNELLNKLTDYRNYMNYEVIVNNDEITDGKLTGLVSYNSGAGTQIPYTIILSAALAMIYNSRENSTRLIFVDEPFEKMSDTNIKIMLDFFKSQDFQVIFCAPDNKLNSIGRECDVLVPIKKISKSNMILGAIEFYE